MAPETTPISRTASVSSTVSSSQRNTSTRAQRRGSRTTNACEACKKRKTKCSGPPSVCEACQKVDTFCHFNLRLDTRRKLAYKPRIVRERQQYILEGVLQILKHNDSNAVEEFIKLIRSEAHPQEIAHSLKHNLHQLQGRGLIPTLDIDETDLVSLGLQSLFSHRAGRNTTKNADEMTSPALSDQHDVRSSFPGLAHNDFCNRPDRRKDSSMMGQEFRMPFGHNDSEERLFIHPDGDSLSEGSTDNTYSQGYSKPLSPTTPQSASTFGSFAGAVLASNTRSLLQHADLQQPEYWRTASSTSLQQNVLEGNVPRKVPNARPDPHLYTPRAPPNTWQSDSRGYLQSLPTPGVSMQDSHNHGKMDRELLLQQQIPHEYWSIPNWAYEVRPAMS